MKVFSRIHFFANDIILFFMTEQIPVYACMCIYVVSNIAICHIFLTCSSVDGHLMFVNGATINRWASIYDV